MSLDGKLDILVRDLVRLLGELSAIYSELLMHARSRLEAIKSADSARLQSITARELLLAARLEEREGLRRQLAERIAAAVGLDKSASRMMRLSELAEKLGEPRRSQLLVAAAGLRERIEQLQTINRTSEMVTRTMLCHLSEVMQVMTSGPGSGDVYGRTGRRQPPRTANVFEAVG